MVKKRIFFLVGLLILTGLCAACGPRVHPKASSLVMRDQAIGLINENNFPVARILLEHSLTIDPNNAKTNYALAICYLRAVPPEREGAIFYRNRAQKLGYVMPAWFDRELSGQPNALEKKAKKRRVHPVSGKVK